MCCGNTLFTKCSLVSSALRANVGIGLKMTSGPFLLQLLRLCGQCFCTLQSVGPGWVLATRSDTECVVLCLEWRSSGTRFFLLNPETEPQWLQQVK